MKESSSYRDAVTAHQTKFKGSQLHSDGSRLNYFKPSASLIFKFKAALLHCRRKQQPAILFKVSKAWKSHKSNTEVFNVFQQSPFHYLNNFLKSAPFPLVREGGQKPTEKNNLTEQGAEKLKLGL